MFGEGLVGAEEFDALGFEVFADFVVDDFGVVLGADAGEEPFLFGFGDAEFVVGVADVVGDVVPRVFVALFAGADEVVDVLEVDGVEVATPLGHGALFEVGEGVEATLPHPVGFVFDVGDGVDDVGTEAFGEFEDGFFVVVEAEFVGGLLDVGFLGVRLWSRGHEAAAVSGSVSRVALMMGS